MSYQQLGVIAIAFGAALVLWLISRELNCWYLKINRRVNQMDILTEKIDLLNFHLREIEKTLKKNSRSEDQEKS